MKHRTNHPHPLINHNLTSKYTTPQNPPQSPLIHLHKINQIVQPKHNLNPYRITFQQTQLQCTHKQYLKRYYQLHQYRNKNMALAQYYKFHCNYPFHLGVQVGLLVMLYQQARNKMQRKFIKMLMNQPVSVSGSEGVSRSFSENRGMEGNGSKQFSLKLRELDIENSTLMLKNLCHEIDVNFQNVKPLYLYRGTYNDGVKEFKKFILASKNYRKQAENKVKVFSKNKHKEQEQLKNVPFQDLQNEKQNNRRNNEQLRRSRFDSNKQFKKTFNVIPAQNFRKLHKKQNFSRTIRNKTVSIKPQSFSKTTVNDTVSREQQPKLNKNRCTSSIRIRKCKSAGKKFLMLENTKSNMNIVKSPQIQSKAKNRSPNRQKSLHKLTKSTLKIIKGNDNLPRNRSNDKKVLKIDRKKTQEKSLSRQQSKPFINMHKDVNKLQNSQKSHTLENLIKNKLKLRA